jgi:beta-galactosidase
MTTARTSLAGPVGASPVDSPRRAKAQSSSFAIGEHDFLLDGEPFRVLSGALHYFRVHPEHWADRIRKAHEMGLNTIETYVAWNAHSPQPGDFDVTGGLDLAHFLDLVAAEGMHAIVRPGPYICAEWNNGGLPAWLFRDGTVGIRRDEPVFMAAVEDFFHQLGPILAPRQIDKGGPIILVQIENEYGAYGNDKAYLQKLVELTRAIGITVPLTTVDQPVDDMLENGGLPGLHKTGSFGSRVTERLNMLRRHQATGPLMCAEFWDGWFDDWGAHHHTTPVAQTAQDLEDLLERGASVNIYMFHGGTNFGFSNGANDKGTYLPITTSYDYDAPLDEAGNPTEKYWAFREVLAHYADIPEQRPTSSGPSPAFSVPFQQSLPLWDVVERLGQWSWHDNLPSADELGHYDGFTLYRTEVETSDRAILEIDEVRDRAQIFIDHQGFGVLARDHHDNSIALPVNIRGLLELLVEDQGRVNYGPRIGEPKGLIGGARLNGQTLRGWEALPLDLSDLTPVVRALRSLPTATVEGLAGPTFARATFDATGSDDLYLDTIGWGKGAVWINGFNLGRYWSRGPQRTLYVPAPILREKGNELIVLELQASSAPTVTFVAARDLGHIDT